MARAGYGDKVEGVHAVAAAAESGRVTRLFVEKRRMGRAPVDAIVDRVGTQRVSVVSDVRPHAETDAPQGVVAECRPIPAVGLDELAGPAAAVLVLDHLQDPQNVGAAARSARAAGMTGMVVSERRSSPLSAAAFKASAGALETLPVAVVGSIPEAIARLKKSGLWVVGLDAGGESNLFGLGVLTEPVAVVIGAEGAGLAELTRKRCDVIASIPMASFDSLNASVTAALASFEIMRARSAAAGSQY
jgi:23S rRNA (guanosine2251-2'-O)-methyltransferase